MSMDINDSLREADGLQAAGHFRSAEASYRRILASHPNAIYAHLRLSETLQSQDRFRNSRKAALAAVDSLGATLRWEALSLVTLRLLAFDERDFIRRLIMSADQEHPAVLTQSPILSQHLWLSGAYDEALELIRRASLRVSPSPQLLYSKANALRYSGRDDDAEAELERCIGLAPNYAQAHWTLAYHRKSAAPGARVDRVRQAIAALTPEDPGQVFLAYALFKELDDAGDTGAAWAALAGGMRAKRASIQYDAAAQAEAIARLARAEIAPVSAAAAASGHRPLFVVGLPRTGTTLLERMLSNHPDVAAGGELGDFSQALSWEADAFAGSPPSRMFQERLGQLDLAAVGARYLARTAASASGKRFLTDKNPSNLYHAAAIARALPGAKVLCLVREPMDACFSNLKELFPGSGYGYSYDFAEMAAQHRNFRMLVEHLQRQLPESFHVVSYEELARAPEATAARIAVTCGLRAVAGLADIAANKAPVLTASSSQVRQPVHVGNVGAWRRYESQLAPLQAMLESGQAQ